MRFCQFWKPAINLVNFKVQHPKREQLKGLQTSFEVKGTTAVMLTKYCNPMPKSSWMPEDNAPKENTALTNVFFRELEELLEVLRMWVRSLSRSLHFEDQHLKNSEKNNSEVSVQTPQGNKLWSFEVAASILGEFRKFWTHRWNIEGFLRRSSRVFNQNGTAWTYWGCGFDASRLILKSNADCDDRGWTELITHVAASGSKSSKFLVPASKPVGLFVISSNNNILRCWELLLLAIPNFMIM